MCFWAKVSKYSSGPHRTSARGKRLNHRLYNIPIKNRLTELFSWNNVLKMLINITMQSPFIYIHTPLYNTSNV